MFHDMPEAVRERMAELERIDARDRADGTPRSKRLRQIPPETGRFIALLAVCAPAGEYVEIGTSAGYSTLWLALACRALDRTITTFEHSPEKLKLAEETFRVNGVDDVVQLVAGDAREHLPDYDGISFCFLDAEKEMYGDCYELVLPRLTPGGLFLADNAISHAEMLGPFLDHALADPRADALVVPVGKGVLLSRKV